jgi:hypothetical protein
MIVHARNLESHVHHGPVHASENYHDVENTVLQTLQFHYMGICLKFPGGTSISHYRPNKNFVEGQFSVSA